METLSKTPGADATREKDLCPPPAPAGVVSDSLSLPSYREYPAHRPFINTLLHTHPKTRTRLSCRPPSPSKAFPETSSAEILSALRNLQEKIKKLELEKGHAEHSLHTLGEDASHTYLQLDQVTQRLLKDHTDTKREISGQSNCNPVLITHLAAAESRCVKLERQLDHMRRMLRNAKGDRTSLLKQQVAMETAKLADHQSDAVSEHAQLEKLERLEQEYLRLTRTQTNTELKIRELEMKLHEEEHQRKLVQDKANQLQTGLETNRILLQSVSPCLSSRQSKEKKSNSKKSSPQRSSYTEPHYRLSLRDVPFVAGTSVGCSHSVRANVQSVLSLLKRHQPHLCNSRVLSSNSYETGSFRHSDSSSSSSSTSGQELSELLQALQEELRLMSFEQEELMRQEEASVSDQERKEFQREQERLLLKMERKGEQISKLYKHKTQMKKLRKEANSRRNSGNEARVSTTVSTRGCSKVRPGERSKRNLRLLRDMRALQTSLRT
ncbi:centrosomal protein of 57 kDa isoform X2 [Etheostoma cragini]|uniref:centrosomal protein of 57 kDa isoform X2 n=1 Tax=Etheostoma cragini TaxID=417921 RepID=UPI00155E6F52|nr:centrosomal protein of 57 kDa isoform X2 [Etheostoma cragini]